MPVIFYDKDYSDRLPKKEDCAEYLKEKEEA
jgi:hypothetical protein